MRVLLVRHGETDWNAAGRIQGMSDIELNAAGRAQAAELAGKRSGEGVSRIYTSPLKRARETAEIIGRALGLRPETAKELTELSFGDWEGLSWGGIAERWPEQFAEYSADRRYYAPPNGESYDEMIARAAPFIQRLRTAPGEGAALCVAHSAVIRGLLADEAGLTVAESYDRIRIPNGAVITLDNRAKV